jgi:hypothetical protein
MGGVPRSFVGTARAHIRIDMPSNEIEDIANAFETIADTALHRVVGGFAPVPPELLAVITAKSAAARARWDAQYPNGGKWTGHGFVPN